MKFWKVVAVAVLLAVPCVLLAWGAVAIGQSAGIAVSAEQAPAQHQQPPVATSTQERGDNVSDRSSRGYDAYGGGMYGGRGYSTSGYGVPIDPLKDVADLAKAEEPQLQAADRYLESKTGDLAHWYAGCEDAEAKAKLKTELTEAIAKHFDVRHEIRKREVDQLEARVKQLREQLQKREAARQTIIDMRLGQFISAAEGLGWDTDLGGSRPRLGSGPYSTGMQPSYRPPSANAPASRSRVRQTITVTGGGASSGQLESPAQENR
jgi:hypothetical protein